MQKEFGEFTTVQIRDFIEFIPQIQDTLEENVIQFPRFIHAEKKNDLGVTLSR